VSGPFSDDRTDDRILADPADPAGRRAASKTNKNNTVARKVSMMGAGFGAELPKLGQYWNMEVDP
jgi:hypothetical protein